jgi:FkbM family methyltransferase
MKLLKQIWHKSFIYKKLDQFVEAKIKLLAREPASEEIWTALEDINYIDSLKKRIDDELYIICYKDSILAKYIFTQKFEQNEIEFIKKYLNEGDVFIDIGSNIGLFSLIGAKYVGKSGKVFSFEPAKRTYQRLIENIKLNNLQNIFALNMAISNIKGIFKLNISDTKYDAWNSFGKPTAGEIKKTEDVITTTIDDFVSEYKLNNISLIKIDVEGWEIPVLQGGKELFSSKHAPTLLVEFTDENAKNAGYSCKELYYILKDFGYTLYTYNSKENKLVIENLREYYPYINLIASKKKIF